VSIREEIARKAAAHRASLRESFHHAERRAALLQLLRCVDHETFLRYIYQRAGQHRSNSTVSQFFGWGLNEALSTFWGAHVADEGIPLFRSEQAMKDWGDSLLQYAARGRRLLF
jgi:hypothetical protein